MTIHHFDRNETYELYEIEKTFFFKGDTLSTTHRKQDLHSALWDLIDWIRMYSFTNFREEDCKAIQAASRSDVLPNRDNVMNTICGKKINRLFYEHAYDLMYYSYMSKNEKFVVLNNAHNFFIYEEIIQLMRFTTLKVSNPVTYRL
jgi:hypothetical protein